MHERRIGAGEILFRKGDEAGEMFYVAEGRLCLVEYGVTLGPGEVVGEIALFSPTRCRTRTIVATIDQTTLSQSLDPAFVRQVVVNEGIGLRNHDDLAANYASWDKGKCLLTFGLTHPFQHLGEMETIASMLDIVWE